MELQKKALIVSIVTGVTAAVVIPTIFYFSQKRLRG